ncbi:MAG: endonuclease III [Chloroflexota bacterium]
MLPPPPYGARARARKAMERLPLEYPAVTELDFQSPWQLVIATILSAQSTDKTINRVTPILFLRYPTPADLAAADPAEVEAILKPTGFFRAKTRAVIRCAQQVVERFGGRVPERMEQLVTLPGIGRKTANVILGVAFGKPGFPVDTHVNRLCNRLGLVQNRDPVKIEKQVCAMIPRREWAGFSLRLILHGRRICVARKPRCEQCLLNDFCPSSTIRPKSRRPPAIA